MCTYLFKIIQNIIILFRKVIKIESMYIEIIHFLSYTRYEYGSVNVRIIHSTISIITSSCFDHISYLFLVFMSN